MAAIYLDNLVKPRQTKATGTVLGKEPTPSQYTYTDLHLDLIFSQTVGTGWDTANTKDIQADYDAKAISNSLVNIITTRPGWKVLSPEFGCRLDKYLFEPLSEFNAHVIASDILRNLEKFETRVNFTGVNITPLYDELQYYIEINYTIKASSMLNKLQLKFNTQALTLNDILVL